MKQTYFKTGQPRYHQFRPAFWLGVQLWLAGMIMGGTGQASTIWYVSPDGNDASAGTSWAAAKQTVQAGVNAAAAGDTVLVTNGVYLLNDQVSITNSIILASVNGAITTTLDGQQTQRCVIVGGSASVAATINGFTLRNGRALTGGGIYCNGGMIKNCLVTNNLAIGDSVNDGTGGGVYIAYGIMSNCTVCANEAMSTNASQSAWGGGVDSYDSMVQACLITNNTCSADNANGGGVVLTGGQLWNSRVTANAGTGISYASGGGVYATILQLSVVSVVEDCVVSNNLAQTTDTYTYTAASAEGGGLFIGNGTIVRSTLISGNTAQSAAGFTGGGGVWTSGSILENDTVVNNFATTQNGNLGMGGGVTWGYNDQCYNNIIRLNSADNGSDNGEVNTFSYPTLFNSDLGPVVPAGNQTNCIATDPLFINAGSGDYRLQPGSLCINTGTNLYWMTGALDLAGNARVSGGTVDMGAYEYTVIPVKPTLSAPTRLPGNGFQFVGHGSAGQNYTIQYATGLTNWNTLYITNAPTGVFTVEDPNATNAFRFYRIMVGP